MPLTYEYNLIVYSLVSLQLKSFIVVSEGPREEMNYTHNFIY